jgi:hypothetical protein
MEVKGSIDAEAHPNNYKALQLEMGKRGGGKEEKQKQAKIDSEAEFSIAEKRVKIIGYFQLAAAIGIAILLVMSLFESAEINTIGIALGLVFIVLNLVAGYTAIKEQYKWYWVSILNQALQVPSIAVGTIMANYSGLGGAYMVIYWGEEVGINFTASFEPGFSFLQLSESLQPGHISLDILAMIFIGALITVKDVQLGANK